MKKIMNAMMRALSVRRKDTGYGWDWYRSL